MTRPGDLGPEARVAALLQAMELVKAGQPLPPGVPSEKRLARMTTKGWLILSRAGKAIGMDPGALASAGTTCPVIEVGKAEPPRLLGLFRLRPEPAARWASEEALEEAIGEDPVDSAERSRAHPALASRVLPAATEARAKALPGKLRRAPRGQRYVPPTPTREALLRRVDPGLVERYAMEEAGAERRRRSPRSPLRFSDGHPAKDLSSAMRLLVTAKAAEVADRMANGTLASWLREEAGEADLAAVVEAADHAARDRGMDQAATRALLLQYIRRTPVGADLERGLIEPMAEALRSRDEALVSSTAQALLLLDSDLAAAELSSALFETEVSGRPHVIAALGETGSPRAVSALERLAMAATRREDREGAMAALRLLAEQGNATEVAGAALSRIEGS